MAIHQQSRRAGIQSCNLSSLLLKRQAQGCEWKPQVFKDSGMMSRLAAADWEACGNRRHLLGWGSRY